MRARQMFDVTPRGVAAPGAVRRGALNARSGARAPVARSSSACSSRIMVLRPTGRTSLKDLAVRGAVA